MKNDIETSLSTAELRDLQCIAGMIIPASTEFGVPGADDPIIFADIVKSLGRDQRDVQAAIGSLSALAGGAVRRPGRVATLRCRRVVSGAWRGGSCSALPRDPAMLLSRRSGGAFVGAGGAATVPEGAHARAGRLVAARPCAVATKAVARCALIRVRVARSVDAAGSGVRNSCSLTTTPVASLRRADQAELRQRCYAVVKADFRNDPAVLELEDGRSGEPHLAAGRCRE